MRIFISRAFSIIKTSIELLSFFGYRKFFLVLVTILLSTIVEVSFLKYFFELSSLFTTEVNDLESQLAEGSEIFSYFLILFLIYILRYVSYLISSKVQIDYFYKSAEIITIENYNSLLENPDRPWDDNSEVLINPELIVTKYLKPIIMVLTEFILIIGILITLLLNAIESFLFMIPVLIILLIPGILWPLNHIKKYGSYRQSNETNVQKIIGYSSLARQQLWSHKKIEYALDIIKNPINKKFSAIRKYNFLVSLVRYNIELIFLIAVFFSIAVQVIYFDISITLIAIEMSGVGIGMLRLMPSVSRMNQYLYDLTFSIKLVRSFIEKFNVRKIYNPDNQHPQIQKNEKKIISLTIFKNKDGDLKINDSMTFKVGENICITGGIGAGKSYFIKSLMGSSTKNVNGFILCDGDSDKFPLEHLRSNFNIGYSGVENSLFPGSLTENIALSKNPTKDESQRSLKLALHFDLLRSLYEEKNLLDGNVSTGQVQLISLCRALFLNPQILFLDEPSSSLDPKTEEEAMKLIAKTMKKGITFIITHRDNPLKYCSVKLHVENRCIYKESI